MEIEETVVPDVAAWRAWLDEHESTSDGIWLVLAKKGAAAPTTLTRDEALDEALCSGWIDGQSRGRDEATSLQRYTPRRRRSLWSARNVGIVGRLTEQGRMRPRGIAEVERAKADGRWDAAYGGSKGFVMPPELSEALAASPRAAAMFEILTSQNRFSVMFRVSAGVKEETRRRNAAKFTSMLERGETVYPQKKTLADVDPVQPGEPPASGSGSRAPDAEAAGDAAAAQAAPLERN